MVTISALAKASGSSRSACPGRDAERIAPGEQSPGLSKMASILRSPQSFQPRIFTDTYGSDLSHSNAWAGAPRVAFL